MLPRILKRLYLIAPLGTPALAQTAELSGLISDPSGLALPGETVSVRSTQTGATRQVVPNQQGLYSVPALPPGSYDMTIKATGFKSVHQNGILLEVDQRASLDFTLSTQSRSHPLSGLVGTPIGALGR